RWQAELLLYDAEELESVERALSAAESVAVGAQGISGAATALPEELGAEMAAQLHEAKAALAELDSALARAQALGEPLSRVADPAVDGAAGGDARRRPRGRRQRTPLRCARVRVGRGPDRRREPRSPRARGRDQRPGCVGRRRDLGPRDLARGAADRRLLRGAR